MELSQPAPGAAGGAAGRSEPAGWRRALALLWVGQVVSHLGDSLFLVGVVWLMLDVTGSKALTGGLVAVKFAPALLLGLLAGAFIDRHDRRRVMLAADLARFAAVLAIPLLHGAGLLDAKLLALLLVVHAIGTVFFNPAIKALIPDFVPTAQLATAAAVFQLSEQIAFIGGPLVGKPAMDAFGFVHLFTLDALTFLFSAACLVALPRTTQPMPAEAWRAGPRAARRGAGGEGEGEAEAEAGAVVSAPLDTLVDTRPSAALPPLTFRWLWTETQKVIRVVSRSPVLRTLLLLTALDNLVIMGPAYVAMPILVKETLGLGPGGYMSAMTYFFLGLTVATLTVWLLIRRVAKGRLISWGIILDGLTFIPLYFCRTLDQVQLALFVHAMAIPLIIIPRTVLMQQTVPGKLLGRLFALVNVTVFGVTGISAALTGGVVELISPPTVFLVAGVLGTAAGLWGLRIRALRAAP